MQIAIDGPAGSGKTSLARALAERFGCRYLETGKMYRAVALGLERGLGLDEMQIALDEDGRLLLNGEDVSASLYTPAIDRRSSQAAMRRDVRELLVELQRQIARGRDVVMEGRDIGTVVLPDADVKLFLRASPHERARRRLQQRGGPSAVNEDLLRRTLQEIEERDARDSSRSLSPLIPAEDATIIDTDRKPLVQVISEAIHLVKERLDGRCCGG